MSGEDSRRGIALTRPHCGTRTAIRSSRLVTEIYREGWAICDKCGFAGKAHVAWDGEVNQSLLPNREVQLPRIPISEAVEDFVEGELAKRDQRDLFVNSG